jgi:mercuric ion binding protein
MTIVKLLLGGTVLALLSGNTMGGEIQSVTHKIEDMTCASCPLTVKQVLKKVLGVTEVHVDFKTRFAKVKFDPDQTEPEQLAKVVTQIGYPTTIRK